MLWDTISMIIYKAIKWDQIYFDHKTRHSFLIVIDAISLIPFEFIYIYAVSKPMFHYVYLIRLRYVLRLSRVFLKLHRMYKSIDVSDMVSSYTELIVVGCLLIMFSAYIEYFLKCYETFCDEAIEMQVLYAASSSVTLVGLTFHYEETIFEFGIFTLVNVFAFFYLKCYIYAKLTSAHKQNLQPWAIFSNRLLNIFQKYKDALKSDFALRNTCQVYYDLFWEHRSALLQPSVEGIIPNILMTELKLEMTWKAFQHSHLFRKEELHFLHYLASYVEHQFMIPGQVLYQKGTVKEKMIYVLSGTVQVMSELDGVTPMLSFTDGTCFGETSLFIPYKSRSTVVCSSYCELTVLQKSNFMKVRSKFPQNYYNLYKQVQKRYRKAKTYVDICNYERFVYNIKEPPRRLSVTRLSYTLAKMLSTDENFEANYIKKLKIGERLWLKSIIGLSFCPYYLDMLVLSTQETLLTDSVFIKSKFPFVFQPKSKILA